MKAPRRWLVTTIVRFPSRTDFREALWVEEFSRVIASDDDPLLMPTVSVSAQEIKYVEPKPKRAKRKRRSPRSATKGG